MGATKEAAQRAGGGRPVAAVRPRPVVGLAAALSGAAICVLAVPATLAALGWVGAAASVLFAVELVVALRALIRPTFRWLALTAGLSGLWLLVWGLTRVLRPEPDPLAILNGTVGTAGHAVAVINSVAVVWLVANLVSRQTVRRSRRARFTAIVGQLPIVAVVVLCGIVGAIGAAGSLWARTPTEALPTQAAGGDISSFVYCRPQGVPMAMDFYTPRQGNAPYPTVLYVHGGGEMLGNRALSGPGAGLANHAGALFAPIQRLLSDRGIAVAAIDYRKLPASRWPAPLEDAECAVRFLRATPARSG